MCLTQHQYANNILIISFFKFQCGGFNFRRRRTCFKCFASRDDSSYGGEGSDEISNILTKSIQILKILFHLFLRTIFQNTSCLSKHLTFANPIKKKTSCSFVHTFVTNNENEPPLLYFFYPSMQRLCYAI